MLREIEHKCLDLYRKEVDVAKLCRAQIQQEIADNVAEIAGICAAMGEQPLHVSLVGTPELSELAIFILGHREILQLTNFYWCALSLIQSLVEA